jgi:ABC transporter DrrB family efflux protein
MAESNGNGSVETVLDLKKIYAIVKKNWMVISSDPLRLRSLLIFPLIMILLYGYTAGKSPEHIPAAIVDYDNSHYSQLVQSDLYADQLFSITRQVGSQDEGKALIESGQAKILFIIPQGFGNDVQTGQTATLSVIVDESDPTIAQITEASTQAAIQSLSVQLTAARVAALSQMAHGLSEQLESSGASVNPGDGRAEQQAMESADACLINGKYTTSQTDSLVAGTRLTMLNSLGSYLYDPNVLVYNYEHNLSSADATYDLMTDSDEQQMVLGQIAQLQGLQGSTDAVAQDTAKMYASTQALYADALQERGTVQLSARIIGNAGTQAQDIADYASNTSATAVTLNQIEPYGSGRAGLDFLIPSIIALIVFQGAAMGMGRAIAGERQDGSLTRVFLTPTSNTTIIAGTVLFYSIFETVRSCIIVAVSVIVFGVLIKGSLLDILVVIAIYAAGATGMGMVLSVMAKTQEQYMALSMLVSLPSMFLAGVFIPIETMPSVLQAVTKILPITYASDALRGIIIKGFTLGMVVPDLLFLGGFAVGILALSVLIFKRELI